MIEISETHTIEPKPFYKGIFGENLPLTVARVRLYQYPLDANGRHTDSEIVKYYSSVKIAEQALSEHGYKFERFIGSTKQIWTGPIDESLKILLGRYQAEAEIEAVSVNLEPTW